MSSLEELSHRHEDKAKLAESDAVPRGAPILELRGLQKKYGLVEALKPDFDFDKGRQRVIGSNTEAENENEGGEGGALFENASENSDFQLGAEY